MDKSHGDSTVQQLRGEPSVETHWQVLTSGAQMRGDNLFIKGAYGKEFDVSIGCTYPADPGIRNDTHDFFGAEISIPMSEKEPQSSKRHRASAGGAPQPSAEEQIQEDNAASAEPEGQPATPKISTSGAAQPAGTKGTEDTPGDQASSSSGAARPSAAGDTEDRPPTPKSSGSAAAQPSAAKDSSSGGAQPAAPEDAEDKGDTPRSSTSGASYPAPVEDPDYEPLTPKSSSSDGAQPAPHENQDDQRVQTRGSSSSGASQPAAPDQPGEKRVAKNGTAYTKAVFFAYYENWSRNRAEQEWAAAPPLISTGPVNSISSRVMPEPERIVQDMYDWWNEHVEDEHLSDVFRHLQNTLFKNVTEQPKADVWQHPGEGGASQPAVLGEARFVVSREYVSRQVQQVIACREEWLKRKRLPLNTVLRDHMAEEFLEDVKAAYHNSAEQKNTKKRISKR